MYSIERDELINRRLRGNSGGGFLPGWDDEVSFDEPINHMTHEQYSEFTKRSIQNTKNFRINVRAFAEKTPNIRIG